MPAASFYRTGVIAHGPSTKLAFLVNPSGFAVSQLAPSPSLVFKQSLGRSLLFWDVLGAVKSHKPGSQSLETLSVFPARFQTWMSEKSSTLCAIAFLFLVGGAYLGIVPRIYITLF